MSGASQWYLPPSLTYGNYVGPEHTPPAGPKCLNCKQEVPGLPLAVAKHFKPYCSDRCMVAGSRH